MKLSKKIIFFSIFVVPSTLFGIIFILRSDFLKFRLKIFVEKSIGLERTRIVRKYFLPYGEIDRYKKRLDIIAVKNKNYSDVINLMAPFALENDLRIKDKLLDLKFKKLSEGKSIGTDEGTVNYDFDISKFVPSENILLRGINNPLPSSGYIDENEDKLFLLSSIGVLGYSELKTDILNFKQIKNNLDDFIGEQQFKKKGLDHEEILEALPFSVKDLLIRNKKIFVSFTNEISQNCWNTSVVYADLNLKEVKFKPLFIPKECVNSLNNPDNVFLAHQSGGRIVKYDKEHILLSTGDYRNRFLAQDKKSTFGKILKVNINDKSYKVISMGSRNIQGLFFDQENDYILFTEHGPKGGDEINILTKEMLSDKEIPNYGWAISSYGFHYRNSPDTKKYPLYKSHKDFGFIEPLKYFTPSIGISQIIGLDLDEKLYLLSSMRQGTIYLVKLNNENKIAEIDNFNIFERVRDMILIKDKVYLFLEDSGSIGVVNIDQFK